MMMAMVIMCMTNSISQDDNMNIQQSLSTQYIDLGWRAAYDIEIYRQIAT